jgi:phosphoenolpyruvate carboxykinase (GTP)
VAPLVYEAFNWRHGVYVGAGMATETTAAQTGAVGVVRRDPMAMLPFCAYNMADYFRHWLDMGKVAGAKTPRIYHVNWFRTDSSGAFLWPGYGQNLRVLKWIAERCGGKGAASETPIGLVPGRGAIELSGLSLTQGGMNDLMTVDAEEWLPELEEQEAMLGLFGKDTPPELAEELNAQRARLGAVSS